MDEGTFPGQDPRPDVDAWEAYLNFVQPLLGGSDSTGLENAELRELESALGLSLPFEVGLLLVMGVPESFPWRNWKTDVASQLETWNGEVAETLKLGSEEVATAPSLLPIFGNVAVPIIAADELPDGVATPLLRIDPGNVRLAGLDLADWLHKEFDLPLPWWPDNEPEPVPFWSDRLS